MPWPVVGFFGSSALVLIIHLLPREKDRALPTLSRKYKCPLSDLSLILICRTWASLCSFLECFLHLLWSRKHSHLPFSPKGAVGGIKVSVDLSPGIQEGRTLTHSLLGSDTCAGIFVSFLLVERYSRQCTGKEGRFLTTYRFRHFSL